ncbi:MAG: acyl-ACP desaturase [Actinobacteria bacterium]|nr:acyl-ACP desaturase [Actinomycetota bacterium]
MAQHAERFLATAALRAWNPFTSIEWGALDADRLTDGQRSAIQFVTLIEDHLPGYFAAYNRRFPVDGSVDLPTFVNNREFYRFIVRWAQEEDWHAFVLFRYQVQAGIASAEDLRSQLAIAGRVPFDVPYEEPVQVFIYTLIQEKVTQLYYQQLSQRVQEPTLRGLLRLLARDEGRHFVFFSQLLQTYIGTFGGELLPAIKDVIQTFKMPLSNTLDRYWRLALEASNAVGGHDYTEAFEELIRIVDRAGDASTRARSTDLTDLVSGIERL